MSSSTRIGGQETNRSVPDIDICSNSMATISTLQVLNQNACSSGHIPMLIAYIRQTVGLRINPSADDLIEIIQREADHILPKIQHGNYRPYQLYWWEEEIADSVNTKREKLTIFRRCPTLEHLLPFKEATAIFRILDTYASKVALVEPMIGSEAFSTKLTCQQKDGNY
ncbi:hypothetical protein HHI36_009869 [Cryptolaemus montrouzieri]|uniref:Uncharacterized protein n=1 Tax=Cryptolaemus montrouzieri TaxID=559131 RepID=A0ABD2MH56_9CUCU